MSLHVREGHVNWKNLLLNIKRYEFKVWSLPQVKHIYGCEQSHEVVQIIKTVTESK